MAVILEVGISTLWCVLAPLLESTLLFFAIFDTDVIGLSLSLSDVLHYYMLSAVVFIGSALFALQQLSGINAVFYFSSAVFRSAGVPSGLANVFIGVVNLSGMTLLLGIQLVEEKLYPLTGGFSFIQGLLLQWH